MLPGGSFEGKTNPSHSVYVSALQAINDKYRTLKHGADLEVCFQEDKITLDIPEEEDMEVKKGWNIASITPPTVRTACVYIVLSVLQHKQTPSSALQMLCRLLRNKWMITSLAGVGPLHASCL